MRAGVWNSLVNVSASDLRHGARRLRRAPAFTSLCALTLAIGIGASTAIFSAVKPILFDPLPYPAPDRIVTIWDYSVDGGHLDVTFGTYREVAASVARRAHRSVGGASIRVMEGRLMSSFHGHAASQI